MVQFEGRSFNNCNQCGRTSATVHASIEVLAYACTCTLVPTSAQLYNALHPVPSQSGLNTTHIMHC